MLFCFQRVWGPSRTTATASGAAILEHSPVIIPGAGIYPEARQSAFIAVGCEQKSAVAGEYEISGMGAAAFRLLDLYSLKAI